MVNHHHSPIIKTSTPPLIQFLWEGWSGKVSHAHTRVTRSLMEVTHRGWMRVMMFGTEILAKLFATCWPILLTPMKWTIGLLWIFYWWRWVPVSGFHVCWLGLGTGSKHILSFNFLPVPSFSALDYQNSPFFLLHLSLPWITIICLSFPHHSPPWITKTHLTYYRTSLLETQRHLGQHSCPSSLAVTKRQFRLQPAIMSIICFISIGNVHNNFWQAHWDAVAIIGFLAMPKSDFF